MTLKEFERSFLTICVRPVKKEIFYKVYARGSRIDRPESLLYSGLMGSELCMNPQLLDKQICIWWIDRDTIIIILENE